MLNFRIHMAKDALARAITRTRAITVRIRFARVINSFTAHSVRLSSSL